MDPFSPFIFINQNNFSNQLIQQRVKRTQKIKPKEDYKTPI